MRTEKNRRLIRNYGITIRDYDRMLAEQGGGCAICGRKPEKGHRALSVDHDHAYKKVKIDSVILGRTPTGKKRWVARAEYHGHFVDYESTLRSVAVGAVRNELKLLSVRGLVCFRPCNVGLSKWRDNPELMERAAAYLRKHQTGGSPAKE